VPFIIQYLAPRDLKSWPRNARTHSDRQVKQLARSIARFGFIHPVLIDEHTRILAGHGRVRAAIELGLPEVPCIAIGHLSEAEKRAYVIADNKLALNSGWDRKLLAEEMQGLLAGDVNFDAGALGFSVAETDSLFADFSAGDEDGPAAVPARCRPGDIWQLGAHRLICGDPAVLNTWWGDDAAQMIITVARGTPGAAQREWSLAALTAAEEAGRRAIFSEGDCASCDRIIERWEAHVGAEALKVERDNEEKPEQTEAAI
jgi:ParB/Sulfiredoxin domain